MLAWRTSWLELSCSTVEAATLANLGTRRHCKGRPERGGVPSAAVTVATLMTEACSQQVRDESCSKFFLLLQDTLTCAVSACWYAELLTNHHEGVKPASFYHRHYHGFINEAVCLRSVTGDSSMPTLDSGWSASSLQPSCAVKVTWNF